jgi:hypothetical protein
VLTCLTFAAMHKVKGEVILFAIKLVTFKENDKTVVVVANFGDIEYLYGKQVIPPHDFRVIVDVH